MNFFAKDQKASFTVKQFLCKHLEQRASKLGIQFQWKEGEFPKFFSDIQNRLLSIFTDELKKKYELYQWVEILFGRVYLMIDWEQEIAQEWGQLC